MLKGKNVSAVKPKITDEQYFDYFKVISSPDNTYHAADSDVIDFVEEKNSLCILFQELDSEITDEINKAIDQLKLNKAAGLDLILNEFIIYGKNQLLPLLLRLFNVMFLKGYFPESWSEGLILPLHKKGSVYSVENYRGITLLSVISKLFTRILNNRLSHWAEHNSVYMEAQGGFPSKMGTIDSMFVLDNVINWFISNKNKFCCAFLDYSKAFDYVVRDNLWYKLLKLGVRGKMFNIIQSIYSTVKSKVRGPKSITDSFECTLGIRQDESLSPLLFSMYVNDLEDFLRNNGSTGIDIGFMKLFVLLYADEGVLLAETSTGLQSGLDILYRYCTRWKLTLNVTKTKILVFRARGKLSFNDKWYYNGNELEIVDFFPYLSIVFSYTGLFTQTQLVLAQQGRKAMFSLRSKLKRFVNINSVVYCDLFDKMVMPVLSYCCEIWGFYPAKAIEQVHKDFCKGILKVKRSTMNEIMYGKLGRIPLIVQRYIRIVKYWLKFLNIKQTRLTKVSYNVQFNAPTNNHAKVNWVSKVRNLLCSCGFGEAWYNQGVGDVNLFLVLFKQRAIDLYLHDWFLNLENSNKALLYRNIKVYFRPSLYLTVISNIQHRLALTQLRTCNHELHVETGSWCKPRSTPFDERLCFICDRDELEDEYHFVVLHTQH